LLHKGAMMIGKLQHSINQAPAAGGACTIGTCKSDPWTAPGETEAVTEIH
jgi:hypothetical protein